MRSSILCIFAQFLERPQTMIGAVSRAGYPARLSSVLDESALFLSPSGPAFSSLSFPTAVLTDAEVIANTFPIGTR